VRGDVSPLRSLSPGERERIIQGILESTSGIYGMEVCQLNGHLSTYRGWASAIGTHRHGEFVCPRQARDPRRASRTEARRWCELCQTPLTRSSAERVGFYWLCACAPLLDRVDDRRRLLHDAGRRRYVEASCISDRRLLQWGRARGVRGFGV
jgi:hypothetical protein